MVTSDEVASDTPNRYIQCFNNKQNAQSAERQVTSLIFAHNKLPA